MYMQGGGASDIHCPMPSLCMQLHSTAYYSSDLLRRLKLFRSQNEDDNTVLNYFDELEIHPEHIGG